MKEIKRREIEQRLLDILDSPKSEFVYLRGRRRVGKSWSLSSFAANNPNCFIFTGVKDATFDITLKTFIQKWCLFAADQSLLEIRPEYLSWSRVFDAILEHQKKTGKKLMVVLDEIQWIAKGNTGFVGMLKNAWVHWQKLGGIKVIVCGSSNQFFEKNVGGDESILRGLQTQATIWVKPLTPKQVREYVCPDWNIPEITLLYFFTGGIPYYLERIDTNKGFIQGVNDAYFLQGHNLLEEVDEILKLDFGSVSRTTCKQILFLIGSNGATQNSIVKRTGISKSTISKICSKLISYKIIFAKKPAYTSRQRNNAGLIYYIKDPFMMFNFSLLEKSRQSIMYNKKGLIFPAITELSNNGYYIPNYTGQAFELFLRIYLEDRTCFGNQVYRKLLIRNPDYNILDYWDKNNQIDLIIESDEDRLGRIIECKWSAISTEHISEVINKTYPHPKNFTVKHALAGISSSFKNRNNILSVINIEDFYTDSLI